MGSRRCPCNGSRNGRSPLGPGVGSACRARTATRRIIKSAGSLRSSHIAAATIRPMPTEIASDRAASESMMDSDHVDVREQHALLTPVNWSESSLHRLRWQVPMHNSANAPPPGARHISRADISASYERKSRASQPDAERIPRPLQHSRPSSCFRSHLHPRHTSGLLRCFAPAAPQFGSGGGSSSPPVPLNHLLLSVAVEASRSMNFPPLISP